MAPGEPDNLKMAPYPAHLWRWRNTLSFAWQNEDNITTSGDVGGLGRDQTPCAAVRHPGYQILPSSGFRSGVPHHGERGRQTASDSTGWLEGRWLFSLGVNCKPWRSGPFKRGTSLTLHPEGLHPTMAPKLHVRFQGLNTKSRANYRRALLRFFAFLKRENLCIPNSVSELDRTLGEFMNESFQEGDSPGIRWSRCFGSQKISPPTAVETRLYTATQTLFQLD